MPNYPTPVKIAAGPLYDALRLQNVLTIETVEAALHEHVYKLWEEQCLFGCPRPLAHDAIERVLDLCHVAESNAPDGPWIPATAIRIAAEDYVNEGAHHESHAEFAAHMLTALRDSATAIDRRTEAGL